MKRLLLYMPVVHRGYVDLFDRHKEDKILLMSKELVHELSAHEPDIAALDETKSLSILKSFGLDVEVLGKENLPLSDGSSITLVNDYVSRAFKEKYLKDVTVEWENVFLRWDRDKIFSHEADTYQVSNDSFDREMMLKAIGFSTNSSDWWRQVGGVVTKEESVIMSSYNVGMPSDHTPYMMGALRDFMEPGERPEIVNTIHAEQEIIAQAARKGISLEGTNLYVTHFPCPICAKLIAEAGISKCYFVEGYSNADGEAVLKSRGVEIYKVNMN